MRARKQVELITWLRISACNVNDGSVRVGTTRRCGRGGEHPWIVSREKRGGASVRLTRTEWAVLEMLLRHPNQLVTINRTGRARRCCPSATAR
ncbi:hypothetical protein GCM10009838_11680 [Catenulispora subtropica]|uniref:OmpR/PhoB-type domain-containing protein n=1 Tax=Catenulispora subtropica TaxID=450798 RepID=A0ABP5C681_9ACTN